MVKSSAYLDYFWRSFGNFKFLKNFQCHFVLYSWTWLGPGPGPNNQDQKLSGPIIGIIGPGPGSGTGSSSCPETFSEFGAWHNFFQKILNQHYMGCNSAVLASHSPAASTVLNTQQDWPCFRARYVLVLKVATCFLDLCNNCNGLSEKYLCHHIITFIRICTY